jgi:hypothetical protein
MRKKQMKGSPMRRVYDEVDHTPLKKKKSRDAKMPPPDAVEAAVRVHGKVTPRVRKPR